MKFVLVCLFFTLDMYSLNTANRIVHSEEKEKKPISAVSAFVLQPPTQNKCEDTSFTAEAAASPGGGEQPALNLCNCCTLTSCDFDQLNVAAPLRQL